MNSGFNQVKKIEWRRAKILELKSQGLEQRERAQILHVSPASITSDLHGKKIILLAKDAVPTPWPVHFSDYIVGSENELFELLNNLERKQ